MKKLCQVAVQIWKKTRVPFQQVTHLLQAISLLKEQTAGELVAIHLAKLHQWQYSIISTEKELVRRWNAVAKSKALASPLPESIECSFIQMDLPMV